MFISPIAELFKELSTKEFAVAMGIIPFISYKDGILRYDGKISDIKTIATVLDEDYDCFRKIISSLIKKNIISKIKRQSDTYQNKTKNCLVVNPYIYLRGQDIEKDIAEKFSGSKWANIDKE